MIKAVIFDMDGTLFDTEQLVLRGWRALVEEGSAPAVLLELAPKWRGRNRSEIKKQIQAVLEPSRSADDLYQRRNEIMRGMLDREGVPLKEGVPEIFPVLQQMGLRLALATASSVETVSDYMARTGYGCYFERIVTGSRVPNGKPAPDIFLLAAEELGLAPSECVVVEDSPNGVRAGIAAGMKTVMVPDLDQPDEDIRRDLWHLCRTLRELPPLMEKEI